MAKKSILKKGNKKVSAKAKPKAKKAVAKKPAQKSKTVKAKSKVKPLAKVKAAVKKVVAKVKSKVTKSKSVKPSKPKTSTKPVNNHKAINKINRKSIPMKKESKKVFVEDILPEEANRARYSDKELEEFRGIINRKLDEARKELDNLNHQITNPNDNGTDDTAGTFKMLEDGSETLMKEEAGQLATRQKKFIEQLENALVRIENKTYGICRVTGKLIPKERLRAVPHTTQSIEAKLNQYRD
jgi:DnaK suppressor protein